MGRQGLFSTTSPSEDYRNSRGSQLQRTGRGCHGARGPPGRQPQQAVAARSAPQLGRQLRAEFIGLEDGPKLERALLTRQHRTGAPTRPLDRLVHRADLPQPVAADELLRLGEWTVDDAALVARELHALGLCAPVKALARQHDASLDELLVEREHSANSFSLGMTPASVFLVALTITMTVIVVSFRERATRAPWLACTRDE
jgi:hypothetical protein